MDRPKGFSLSEVLVVLTVILILAALLLATIGDVYVLGQRVACQHRLQQLHHACQMFSNKHRGRELRYLDLLGGDSGRWYEKLLPFLGAESVAEAGDYINCPCAELAETDGLIGGGRGLGLPVLIYRTVSAASYGSYEGVRDDLRASEVFFGGCDLVHYGEPEEAGIVAQTELERYGQFWLFSLSELAVDAFAPANPNQRDPEVLRLFRERDGGGLLLVGDHSGYLMSHFGGWNVSLNTVTDHCKLGICLRQCRSHNENVQSTGHFIGNGITWLPQGTAWGSVGYVSIDDRADDERAERHAFVSYPVVCRGEQPAGAHCPWPEKILPGVHEQPCGVIGVMDDGLGRVCVGSTFTRWGTSYYTGTTDRRAQLRALAEQMAVWLAGGKGRGGSATYGYNNQIGVGPEDKGLGPTPPDPGRTIRILDYAFYQADHDGKHGADDDITCIAPRHGGRANVLFVDGHVEALTPEAIMDESRNYWDVQK